MSDRDRTAIYRACARFLPGHAPQTIRETLAELAAYTPADAVPDVYGAGEVIEDFEAHIAELLGKPAAVFMPSGTMAQQIALRIWAERSGRRAVAFHPTCHLEIHEQDAYRVLHGLRGVRVGGPYRLLTLDDLQAIKEPLGALLLELPQRHIGGALPTWEALNEIAAWAREQRVILHMDGARLWECGPYYGRSYAEIADLFDSVYVSFYKTLGGITGAALAGPEDVIAEARIWQRRHGGNLFHLYPYVLSAQSGLEHRLAQMAAYHEQAVAIGEALAALEGIEVTPDPPQAHMMHLFLRGDHEQLSEAALDLAEDRGIWLVSGFGPAQVPGWATTELSLGDGALDFTAEEVAALFGELLAAG